MEPSLVLLGYSPQTETIFEFGDRNQTIEQPTAIGTLNRPGILGMAGFEFPGNGLHDVLKGHNPEDLAVFVDDERELDPGRTEVLQQFHASQTFGHKDRRLKKAFARQVQGFAAQGCPQEGTRCDDAHHIMQPTANHREPGVLGCLQTAQVFFCRDEPIEHDDIPTRHHQ